MTGPIFSLPGAGESLLSGELTIDELVRQATTAADGPVFSGQAMEDLRSMDEANARRITKLLWRGIPGVRSAVAGWQEARVEKDYVVSYRLLDKAELAALGRGAVPSGLDVLIGAIRRESGRSRNATQAAPSPFVPRTTGSR